MATATRGTPSGTWRDGSPPRRRVKSDIPAAGERDRDSQRPATRLSRRRVLPMAPSTYFTSRLARRLGADQVVSWRNFPQCRFRAVSQFSASSCLSRAPRAKSLAISVITHSGTILRIAQVLLYMPTAVSVPRCQPSQRSCLRHHLLAFCIEVIHLAIPKGTH